MEKITKQEYEILKSLANDFRFILRNKNGNVFVSQPYPYKRKMKAGGKMSHHWYHSAYVRNKHSHKELKGYRNLFSVVKWSDKNPQRISKLLKIYENYGTED